MDCFNQRLRFIGLDFGDKTIGIAVGCPDSQVATGLETIRRTQAEALRPSIQRLGEIINAYSVTHIILGYPMHMDGSISSRAEKTLAFRDKLKRNFKSIMIILWDERLSTQAVTRAFYADSVGGRKRRKTYSAHVDEMAAVYILQGYLDSKSTKQTINKDLQKYISTEVNMENETNMPDENMGDVILMSDEDGNEYQLQVLATKEAENCIYLLTAIDDDEDEASDVLHFKCPIVAEEDLDAPDSDEDEMALELIEEGHEDFELVLELFKDDYANLGIIIDEEDPLLGVQEK